MKEIPKVSVIVPVYRGIEYIGELLSSLQNRMQRAMQFVYVDVKAGDGSFDIVREAAQYDNHRPDHFFILRRVYSKPADSARQVAPIRCDLSGMRDNHIPAIRRELKLEKESQDVLKKTGQNYQQGIE